MKSFINTDYSFKIILILLIVWPKIFFGQTYFNMLYPPEPGTWGGGTRTIVVTDSSYVMNRWAIANSSGNQWFGFTSIDLSGESLIISDTLHYTDKLITFSGIINNHSNTFIDVSSIKVNTPIPHKYGIVKYDSLGHIIFHKIDTNLYPYIYIKQVISLVDGSIISVGDLDEIGNSWKDQKVLLLKSDSLGNEIWKKTYSIGSYAEKGESVSLCADGGFIIGGAELIINGPDRFYSPIVIKTDSNGNVQWKKKYGSTQYSNWPAYGITQTQDGGYAFCGGVGIHDSSNAAEQLPWVVKLDASGTILWADTNYANKAYPDLYYSFYRDIIELHDGSLVVCGQQLIQLEDPNLGYQKTGVLKKLDEYGSIQWTRNYTHPEITEGQQAHDLYDIDPTPDGGFVAAGWAGHTADLVQSTWVIKVDSFGCLVPGCEVVSVPKIQSPIASLKVYPNPASEVLHIDITSSAYQKEFTFELYDILGKRVLTQTLYPYENTINVGGLSTGVYTYKIGEVWGQVVVK